jgi:transcriptional regulator with XRE-family HTH domain
MIRAPRGEPPQTVTRNPGTVSTRRVSLLPIDRQRAEFLRSCRARIKPADLGLPAPQRRRTEGLRREDVAALSGVSVAWYTWLEQGREMRVSDEVLERISQTFRLTDDERSYLFSLVQHRPPRLNQEPQFDAPPEIARMIEAVAMPAVLMNLRWDVLAWNELNTEVFRDYAALPPAERNLLELLFTRRGVYGDPEELELLARRVLAKLRVDYSNASDDPRFESLIQRLEMTSPLFRRMWRRPEINSKSYGIHRFAHERFGPLSFEHTSYVPEGHPGLRMVLCLPQDAATIKVIETLRRDFAQRRSARNDAAQ